MAKKPGTKFIRPNLPNLGQQMGCRGGKWVKKTACGKKSIVRKADLKIRDSQDGEKHTKSRRKTAKKEVTTGKKTPKKVLARPGGGGRAQKKTTSATGMFLGLSPPAKS